MMPTGGDSAASGDELVAPYKRLSYRVDVTWVQGDADAGGRLLEALKRQLDEAPSRICRLFGDVTGRPADGITPIHARIIARFLGEVAIELGDLSLLGRAEILDRVACEMSELDDRDEEEMRREMKEKFGGTSGA